MSAATIRLATIKPTRTELIPWTDRRGRLHPLRATVFALLLVPGLWLAARWFGHRLGPEPVNAAIHSTGYWTVWLLLASLAITPLKALAAMPNVVVIRRMIGNAALVYALIHLALYATDQHWRLMTIASEILKRFYLTIGFVALCGLVLLGLTSTDGWTRALGRTWKRLHRLVYGLLVLGLIHYVLQSKLDVSQALLAAGVYTWFMLWRVLPAGRDREWAPLFGIALASAILTLAYEYGWYRFGTRINPMKVLTGEFDIAFGLHPAGQVLLLGLLAVAAAELRRMSMAAFGATIGYAILIYGLGGLAVAGVSLFLGWTTDLILPETWSFDAAVGALVALLAALGALRWWTRADRRWLVDGVWAACVLAPVALVGWLQ